MSSTPSQASPSQRNLKDFFFKILSGIKGNDVDWFIDDDTPFESIFSESFSRDNYQSVRALYTLSNVISITTLDLDERELVTRICRTISDSGGYSAAAYTRPHPDPQKPTELVTANGVSLINQFEISSNPDESNNTITPRAILTGKIQVCGDIISDEAHSRFHSLAKSERINSAVALPVFGENENLLGCLSIYAPENGAFKDNEVSILNNISKILSFCISSIRTREHNFIIVNAMDQIEDGVVVLDHSGVIIYANKAASKITRFDYNDLAGCHFSLIAPDGTSGMPDSLQAAMDNKTSWSGRWTAARKTGDNFVANVTVSPFFDRKQGSIYYYLVFNDTTAFVAMEALQKQKKALESTGKSSIDTNKNLNDILSTIIKHTNMSLADMGNTDSLSKNLDQILSTCERARDKICPVLTPVPNGPHAEKPKPSGPTSEIARGDETILLVDDDPALVDSLTMLLTSLGYQVVGKTSSLSALRDFKSSPHIFDLIITDITMPEMRGNELTRHILEIRPEIPIILCSGLFDHRDTELPEGNISILDKPSRISEISSAIRCALEKTYMP